MKKFTRSMYGKTTLFLSEIILACMTVLILSAILCMVPLGVYRMSETEVVEQFNKQQVMEYVYQVAFQVENEEVITERDSGSLKYCIYDSTGRTVARSKGTYLGRTNQSWEHRVYFEITDLGYPILYQQKEEYVGNTSDLYEFCAYIDRDSERKDLYIYGEELLRKAYSLKYVIIPMFFVCFIFAILIFLVLMRVSGRRNDTEELTVSVLDRIPLDLLCGVIFLILLSGILILSEFGQADEVIIGGILYVPIAGAMLLGLCMSIAVRIKAKIFWKNNLCYYICRWSVRIGCYICRWSVQIGCHICRWSFGFLKCTTKWCIKYSVLFCRKCIFYCKKFIKNSMQAFGKLCLKLPFLWKVLVVFGILQISEMIAIEQNTYIYDGGMVAFMVILKLVECAVLVYVSLVLLKLKEGGKKLAEGNVEHQIDVSKMFGEFKAHGEALNRIADGINLAVEQKLKSERMKTELITNVSHDIKTPLTSIINYVDLMEKEECDNETIQEYTEILKRQSKRLKRLMEDLVEASKAATGNLEVLLAPCDAGMFLSQLYGEYEESLHNCGLELIVTQPQDAYYIMADGRRMQRIFDNLMNNIRKYAQRGTRVYVSLTEEHQSIKIILKNTSSTQLNISAEELMERFVRGDMSRHTEGNGLGLSIAKSLVELQNGQMDLVIDGDLFKVILTFPQIEKQEKEILG